MIIIMEPGASQDQISQVEARVEELGFRTIVNRGDVQVVVAMLGDESSLESTDVLEELPGVNRVERVQVPFRLASRVMRHQDSVFEIMPGVTIGSRHELTVMAGPCSVESEENIVQTAKAVKEAGGQILRGGAFKPRTAPRTFEGLKEEGLRLLGVAKQETGLGIVTEIMDVRNLERICEVADVLQVGARNMQNFTLLDELGKCDKPVMLKRGMAATIDEWLLAAERLLHHGNHRVILCERGIRSFDAKYTRNVFDVNAIAVAQKLSHLPVIADPSHATGKSALVKQAALAAVAAGAQGLIVETHPDPANALSDGPQSLKFEQFKAMMEAVQSVHASVRDVYDVSPTPLANTASAKI